MTRSTGPNQRARIAKTSLRKSRIATQNKYVTVAQKHVPNGTNRLKPAACPSFKCLSHTQAPSQINGDPKSHFGGSLPPPKKNLGPSPPKTHTHKQINQKQKRKYPNSNKSNFGAPPPTKKKKERHFRKSSARPSRKAPVPSARLPPRGAGRNAPPWPRAPRRPPGAAPASRSASRSRAVGARVFFRGQLVQWRNPGDPKIWRKPEKPGGNSTRLGVFGKKDG